MSKKKEESKKINCNVCECSHNCMEDCTCKLESINVCPCTTKKTQDPLKDTACGSYEYSGNLNAEEITSK
ncbi:MAG: DUF1540 domain-containing protein [Clostridia bacterium]